MHSHRVHTAIAIGAFLTFGVASAVAVGAIPGSHSNPSHPTVAARVAAPRQLVSSGRARTHAAVARAHHPAAVTHKLATTTTHHAAAAATPSSGTSTPRPAATHSHNPQPARQHRPAAATTPTPAKPRITKPKLAPRTTPSAAAVQAAIQGLKGYVHSILSPSPAQVAQFGDMVCSAYDAGEATKKIENEILQKVSALPLTTILPGAADYVVRTAVHLYCPAYTSRLGSAAA